MRYGLPSLAAPKLLLTSDPETRSGRWNRVLGSGASPAGAGGIHNPERNTDWQSESHLSLPALSPSCKENAPQYHQLWLPIA